MRRTEDLKGYIQRWNIHHRLQHILLLVSVTLLILTGFPMKYAYTSWAPYAVALFGGFDLMFRIHLVAAVLLVIAAIYHIIYAISYALKHGPTWDMVPSVQDVKDAFNHIRYLVGLTDKHPHFGRYNYLQKFEYFAVVWGLFFMGITGFFLWFPQVGAMFFPRWILGVFRVIHSNEAFLAMLAIAFGHFFMEHFNPDVFPMNKTWLNGKISLEKMAEHHPAEFERLNLEEAEIDYPEKTGMEGRFKHSRALVATELAVVTFVFGWLLYTFIPMLLS